MLRTARQLADARVRAQMGLFLVEGTNLCEEALTVGWPLAHLICTRAWLRKHEATRRRCAHVNLTVVDEKELSRVATTKSPDGVVAIAHTDPTVPVHDGSTAELFASKRARQLPANLVGKMSVTPETTLALVANDVQTPGNLGSLIRATAATGSGPLFVGGALSPDVFHPKVLRGSAGMWFRSPPVVADTPRILKAIKRVACGKVYAAVPAHDSDSVPFWEVDMTVPVAFVVGNEGNGIEDGSSVLDAVDAKVNIPMHESVESLNVGVSGALLLYEAIRQRGGVPGRATISSASRLAAHAALAGHDTRRRGSGGGGSGGRNAR